MAKTGRPPIPAHVVGAVLNSKGSLRAIAKATGVSAGSVKRILDNAQSYSRPEVVAEHLKEYANWLRSEAIKAELAADQVLQLIRDLDQETVVDRQKREKARLIFEIEQLNAQAEHLRDEAIKRSLVVYGES